MRKIVLKEFSKILENKPDLLSQFIDDGFIIENMHIGCLPPVPIHADTIGTKIHVFYYFTFFIHQKI